MAEIYKQTVSAERVPSGIAGFDQLLQGGFFKGETYLLMGQPGAGKTIFGNQICFNHVANGGRAIYMTLLAETHSRMLTHMQSFEFYSAEPLANQLSYISGSSILEQKGLDALLTLIRKEVRKQHATLLVIDGTITIEQNATSLRERKDFLHALNIIAELVGCVALLLMQCDRDRYDQPEHTMVDGLIQLSASLNDIRAMREIQIHKFRGGRFLEGRHLYTIKDQGFIIYPRTEEALKPLALPSKSPLMPETSETKMGFGLGSLDEMIHGGVPIGSSTMVLGSPGTGKTLLGLHFLYQGVSEGQQGLYFGFSETPKQLRQRMNHLLLSPLQNSKTSPPENTIPRGNRSTTHTKNSRDSAEKQNTTASPERLNIFFPTIFTALRSMDVTTIWAVEQADLFTSDIVMPELISKMASQVENIVFLRHVELYSQLYHLISIMKMRQSGYDPSIREFRITDHGLDVASTFKSTESILTGIARPRESPPASSFGIGETSIQGEQQ